MLDATRLLYAAPPRAAPSPHENSDSESSNGTDFRFGKQTNVSVGIIEPSCAKSYQCTLNLF